MPPPRIPARDPLEEDRPEKYSYASQFLFSFFCRFFRNVFQQRVYAFSWQGSIYASSPYSSFSPQRSSKQARKYGVRFGWLVGVRFVILACLLLLRASCISS